MRFKRGASCTIWNETWHYLRNGGMRRIFFRQGSAESFSFPIMGDNGSIKAFVLLYRESHQTERVPGPKIATAEELDEVSDAYDALIEYIADHPEAGPYFEGDEEIVIEEVDSETQKSSKPAIEKWKWPTTEHRFDGTNIEKYKTFKEETQRRAATAKRRGWSDDRVLEHILENLIGCADLRGEIANKDFKTQKQMFDWMDAFYEDEKGDRRLEKEDEFRDLRRDDGASFKVGVKTFEKKLLELNKLRENPLPDEDAALALLRFSRLDDTQDYLVRRSAGEMKYESIKREVCKLKVTKPSSQLVVEKTKPDGADSLLTKLVGMLSNYWGKGKGGGKFKWPYKKKPEQKGQNEQDRKKGKGKGKSSHKKEEKSKSKLCFRCGSPDHFVRDCPLPDPRANFSAFVTPSESLETAPTWVWSLRYLLYPLAMMFLLCEMYMCRANPTFVVGNMVAYTGSDGAFGILDCGCPTHSIVGEDNLKYFEHSQKVHSHETFRFGDGAETQALCKTNLSVKLDNGAEGAIGVEVVPGSLPLLISTNSMKKLQLTLAFNKEKVECFMNKKVLPLRKMPSEHVAINLRRPSQNEKLPYVPIGVDSIFMASRVRGRDAWGQVKYYRKLHESLGHPSRAQLEKLLRSSGGALNHEALDEVYEMCEVCRITGVEGNARPRVDARLPTRFGEFVAFDICYMGKKKLPTLVATDLHSRYTVATRIGSKTADSVASALLKHWIAPYGAPESWIADAARENLSQEFLQFASFFGSKVRIAAGGSHWSNGAVERRIGILKQTVWKLELAGYNSEDAIFWAVDASNSLPILGSSWSPRTLAFGLNRRSVEEPSEPTKSLAKKLAVREAARVAVVELDAAATLAAACQRQTGKDAAQYAVGDKVYYKDTTAARYSSNRVKLGVVEAVDGRVVKVRAASGHLVSVPAENMAPVTMVYAVQADEQKVVVQTKAQKKAKELNFDELSEEHKQLFHESDRKEWNSIMELEVAEKISLAEAKDKKLQLLPSRVVRTWKLEGKKAKSRIVVKGYMEDVKDSVASPTVARTSVKSALTLPATKSWKVSSLDVSTAFLRSFPFEECRLGITCPKDHAFCEAMGADPATDCFVLRKPLYGLKVAPLAWYRRLKDTVVRNGGVPTADPGLFVFHDASGKVTGYWLCHVDDCLYSGSGEVFHSAIANILQESEVTKIDTVGSDPVKHLGMHVRRVGDTFYLSQREYIEKRLDPLGSSFFEGKLLDDVLRSEDFFTSYRSVVGSLIFLNQTRCDLCYQISTFAQKMSMEGITVRDARALNQLVAEIKRTSEMEMAIKSVDVANLKILNFSDAGFGKPAHPQMGSISILGSIIPSSSNTATVKGNVLSFWSRVSTRVARSTLAAVTYSAAHGVDQALLLKKVASQLFGKEVQVQQFTDCQSLVDCVSSESPKATEARVLLEVLALKESLKLREFEKLSYVSTATQIADGLTKENKNMMLKEFLKSNEFEISYEKSRSAPQ